jgi:hypothetical protein
VLRPHPVLQIGRADGAVLDAVAPSLTRVFALSPGHGVQRVLDSAVADGVHRALKALPVRAANEIIASTLVPVEDAAVRPFEV